MILLPIVLKACHSLSKYKKHYYILMTELLVWEEWLLIIMLLEIWISNTESDFYKLPQIII